MNPAPDTESLPPSLRFLKGLVITLMVTMIIGVITISVVLVTRMPGGAPILPEGLVLPDGSTAHSVTMARDYILVTTTDGRALVFNVDGSLRQDLRLSPTP
ncbi:MAG: DUF6476 family protein [Cypionkella sp.]|nr:DUF6476 family protein [Cypionkella sp.]